MVFSKVICLLLISLTFSFTHFNLMANTSNNQYKDKKSIIKPLTLISTLIVVGFLGTSIYWLLEDNDKRELRTQIKLQKKIEKKLEKQIEYIIGRKIDEKFENNWEFRRCCGHADT